MSKKAILFGALFFSLAFVACNNDSTTDAEKAKQDSIRKDSIRQDSLKKEKMKKEAMDSTGVKDKKPIVPSGKPGSDSTGGK